MEAYSRIDERLKAVEAISNDPGIKAIRANLVALRIWPKRTRPKKFNA